METEGKASNTWIILYTKWLPPPFTANGLEANKMATPSPHSMWEEQAELMHRKIEEKETAKGWGL